MVVTPPPIVLPPTGKHLKGKSGHFSAPDYPQPYKSNTNRIWIIEVPEGYVVYIQIFNISIEYVYMLHFDAVTTQLLLLYHHCYYREPCGVNHVAVFNGRTDNRSILIDEYCGSNVKNKFITLSSNFGYIKFQTGSSANTKGYTGFAKITFEARGTIIYTHIASSLSQRAVLALQILMSAGIFSVTINVPTWRDLTNVHVMMATIWTEMAEHVWVVNILFSGRLKRISH